MEEGKIFVPITARYNLKGATCMKLTYHRSGDYLLPNLAVPDAPISLGKYGRMRAVYLKEHKPILYNNLLLSGKLANHLAEVDTVGVSSIGYT